MIEIFDSIYEDLSQFGKRILRILISIVAFLTAPIWIFPYSVYKNKEKNKLGNFERALTDYQLTENYLRAKSKMTYNCKLGFCPICKLDELNNGIGVDCKSLERDYPEKAIEIVSEFAKFDHFRKI